MQLRKTCTVLGLLITACGVQSQAAKAAVIGISAEIGDGPCSYWISTIYSRNQSTS